MEETVVMDYQEGMDRKEREKIKEIKEILHGPVGPTRSKGEGGVVYTHWGRTSCPSGTGAQLLYEGIVGGSHWDHSGGSRS